MFLWIIIKIIKRFRIEIIIRKTRNDIIIKLINRKIKWIKNINKIIDWINRRKLKKIKFI